MIRVSKAPLEGRSAKNSTARTAPLMLLDFAPSTIAKFSKTPFETRVSKNLDKNN